MNNVLINDEAYWDSRFGTGDWEAKGGFSQTRMFAESLVPLLRLPSTFSGTLCDFGCGGGDAIPVYRAAMPQARLVGVDFSQEAVRLAVSRFGATAEFLHGAARNVPLSDITICSNVLEHLADDIETVKILLARCHTLVVAVPYKERPLSAEHVRAYDESSFSACSPLDITIFGSRGWTQYGLDLLVNTYAKNVARLVLGRPLVRRRMQMLVRMKGRL